MTLIYDSSFLKIPSFPVNPDVPSVSYNGSLRAVAWKWLEGLWS